MKKTAILFDFDGTLANTIPGIMATMKDLKSEMNADFSLDKAFSLIGRPLVLMGEELVGKGNANTFVNEYLRLFNAKGRKHLSYFDGAPMLLSALQERGITIAVVTSKRKDSLLADLEHIGYRECFDLLVTNDDTTFHKPHPAPVEYAMDMLGKYPKDCIMVGDTQFDILAAKGGGVDSIGVTWGIENHDAMAKNQPTYMADSMKELEEILLKMV